MNKNAIINYIRELDKQGCGIDEIKCRLKDMGISDNDIVASIKFEKLTANKRYKIDRVKTTRFEKWKLIMSGGMILLTIGIMATIYTYDMKRLHGDGEIVVFYKPIIIGIMLVAAGAVVYFKNRKKRIVV